MQISKNTQLKALALFAFCLALTLMLGAPTFAQEEIAAPPEETQEAVTEEQPTKEDFLAAWEEHQRSLPTTVTLEKTDEPGVYTYETTLFPYKGTLKVLNIAIGKKIDYWSDYELHLDREIKGAVETKLPDLPKKELYDLYPYSSSLWRDQSFLFYNDDVGKWLNVQEWREWKNKKDRKKTEQPQEMTPRILSFGELVFFILPVIIAVFYLVIYSLTIGNKQKENIKRFDLSLERQLKALEIEKEMLKTLKEIKTLLRQK